MRNDKSGEKRENRISDRFNRGNNVDRSVIDYLNSGVSKCGYGTEEKQDKVQNTYNECDNFKIGEGNMGVNKFVDKIIFGMK